MGQRRIPIKFLEAFEEMRNWLYLVDTTQLKDLVRRYENSCPSLTAELHAVWRYLTDGREGRLRHGQVLISDFQIKFLKSPTNEFLIRIGKHVYRIDRDFRGSPDFKTTIEVKRRRKTIYVYEPI